MKVCWYTTQMYACTYPTPQHEQDVTRNFLSSFTGW